MDGIKIGDRIGKDFTTMEAALQASYKHRGNEVVLQRDDGAFELHHARVSQPLFAQVLATTVDFDSLDPAVVAVSVERPDTSSRSCFLDRGLANGQVILGSEVVPGASPGTWRFRDPEAVIAQMDQRDRLRETDSDGSRCGAQNMLATAIRRGPVAVQRLIDTLAADFPEMKGVKATDSLTPREIGLTAHAMYRKARGNAPSPWLDASQLATLAVDTGLTVKSRHAFVAQRDPGLKRMADGETRMFLVEIKPNADHPGRANHWVSISRLGPDFVVTDTGRSQHRIAFSSATEAQAWLQRDFPTKDVDGDPTDQAEMLAIPPPRP